MIRVPRSPKPAILERNQHAWTSALRNASSKAEKERAEKKYRHRSIKDALVAMFHSKCAYCESKITHVDYGHIEHFKPRSRFGDLTFEWTNMLLSCPVCNGSGYKGDRFPQAPSGPLINPCDENPSDHLEFFFDRTAKLASVIGKTTRGQTTEKILGLNRYGLREYRSTVIMRLRVLLDFAKKDPAAQELLEDACRDESEYAAFVRSLVGSGPT